MENVPLHIVANLLEGNPYHLRTLTIFVMAISAAYIVSQILAMIMAHFARRIARASDTASNAARTTRLRRLETFLSIIIAFMRLTVFVVALMIAWQLTSPSTTPVGLVSASVVFVVLAGATLSPLLRDITTGTIMIAEQWYNVGDHITVLPFSEVEGVVERMNLRSTRIRNLDGEVIWIHNQNIQGVKVSAGGVKTIAIDVFVNNLEKGEAMVAHVGQTLPVEATMLASPLHLVHSRKLGSRLWHLTAIGQTAPGREWLLEDFARAAMEEYAKKAGKIIVHGPIARGADETAQRRFQRIVRLNKKLTTTESKTRRPAKLKNS